MLWMKGFAQRGDQIDGQVGVSIGKEPVGVARQPPDFGGPPHWARLLGEVDELFIGHLIKMLPDRHRGNAKLIGQGLCILGSPLLEQL